MSLIGRPMSVGIRLNSFSAIGVKRRTRRFCPRMTIAIWTLPSRLTRSLLSRFSSALRFCSSSLTVASSSLLDWISSLEVSSSSLMLCSSSLADCTSSLADCSSSLAASCCSITDWRYSRVAASSCARRAFSPSASLVPAAAALALLPSRESAAPRRSAALRTGPGSRLPPAELPLTGTTSRWTSRVPPSDWTRSPSSRTGASSLPGLAERGPQRDRQPLPHHLEQVQAGLARRRRQVRPGVPAELQDLQIGVDQHAGRGVPRQEDAVGLFLHVGRRHGRERTGIVPGSSRSRWKLAAWPKADRRAAGFLA